MFLPYSRSLWTQRKNVLCQLTTLDYSRVLRKWDVYVLYSGVSVKLSTARISWLKRNGARSIWEVLSAETYSEVFWSVKKCRYCNVYTDKIASFLIVNKVNGKIIWIFLMCLQVNWARRSEFRYNICTIFRFIAQFQ